MYDDILGEVDKIREIKNRNFNTKEIKKEEDEELGLFEELILELDYEV